MMFEKKVNTKPVYYAALNQLSQDFETRFVPQTELSAKQVFWSQNSVNSEEPNLSTRPTQVEVPKELSKDHGVNPPHIDECCCECGNALDGIFCQQCICKSCGKGAHAGYNCPPKIPIIYNPESCNQTMNNELPQTLPSFDPTCYSDKEKSVPCVSKPNFVDESSNIFNPPPQPPIYSCEFCGSNNQYGHYCTPQAPFINPEPGYSQDFNFPQNIHNFQQQYLCCDQCEGPHETFQWNVKDKILVTKLPKNYARCAKCGHPVNGPYCQGCSLLLEKLEEHLVSYFQNFQNTSESSNDSTNVINAPREPFVVKKDHGVNPPHIDKCCCECGNALDGIFCQQCTCKSCGKGAHIGYNCPPKGPIISNPEPCNQTMNNELPQTLPGFDPTCYSDKENSVPCISKPNFVDESSNIFNPPPKPPIYYCEFCGSNAQYGHYSIPQAPFINPEPVVLRESGNVRNLQWWWVSSMIVLESMTINFKIATIWVDQLHSTVRVDFRDGEWARPTGFKLTQENLESGIKKQHLITNIENAVFDLVIVKLLSPFFIDE
nr:hypothetical protein [Tanacetum cinerariifolium]